MAAFLDKTRKLFLRGALGAALVSALIVLALSNNRAADWLESGTYDARVRLTAQPTADPDIVIIDVDDASFDAMKQKGWRWPWTRRAWAATVRHIAPGKPRAIVFDVIFGGRESEAVDNEFAAEMKSAGNVVLAYTFSESEVEEVDPSAKMERWKLLERENIPAGSLGEAISPEKYVFNGPLPEFADAAAGMGSIGAAIDRDGAIRRVPLEFRHDEHAYQSLASRTVSLVRGDAKRVSGLQPGHYKLDAASAAIPTDAEGRLLLVWHKNLPCKPDPRNCPAEGSFAYKRVPIWQIFCSLAPAQCDPSVEKFAPEYFRGKIVIIAASAAGSYDVHPTPFKGVAPGFIAHATAMDNLLHGEAMRPAPRWFLPLAVFAMALASALILARIQSTTADLTATVLLLALYTSICFWAFAEWSLWLPLVPPAAALVLSYFATGAVRYATTGRELRQTRGTLDRYISPQLVNYVLGHLDTINLRGEKRELTIFFSDVRNFTTLTEGTDPMELIALLNEYLTAMTEIIFKYDGIVDKFIGDGILAYWGAFTPGRNHALLASQASLEMLERLRALNESWKAQGRKQLDIGIGLNSGEVIFGNVGSGRKIEFTVIGDPVNLASRLEGLNKEFKTSIIISEFTLALLGERARARALGGVKVKGKTVETAVFELQGLNPDGAGAAEPAAVRSAG